MRWFMRINGILSAGVHDMIDRCENPERQLRQAVRDMEASLQRTVDRAVKVLAEEKLLTKRARACEEREASWRRRAAEALAKGDEPAARTALHRKLECRRLHDSITEQLTILRQTCEQLRVRVSQMRENLHVAQGKLAVLVARHEAAVAKRAALHHDRTLTRDDSAFETFQRMAEKIERTEAEADALTELTEATLEPVESPHEIELDVDVELEELKRELQDQG